MPPEKPRSNRRRSPQKGWDPLAAWYDGWVGEEGSHHHQKLAIPATLELLNPSSGERILDVGCGQGVLAPSILKAGAGYTGVDASPRLIRTAQKRHGAHATFLLGDARALQSIPDLEEAEFDAAVCLLSLQDIEPLEEVLEGVSWAVRAGGRLVALLTHPCFRIPRQSGWGWDPGRKLRFRRVDRYLTPLPVPLKAYPGRKEGVSWSYHRPLQNYINSMGRSGFAITAMKEMPTYKKKTGEGARAENRANQEIPLFLGLHAVKLPAGGVGR